NQILELAKLDAFGLDDVAAVLSASGPHGNVVKDFRDVPRIYNSVSYWKNDEWTFVEVSLASPAVVDWSLLLRLLQQLEGGQADVSLPDLRGTHAGILEIGGANWVDRVELWSRWETTDPTCLRVQVHRFQVNRRLR